MAAVTRDVMEAVAIALYEGSVRANQGYDANNDVAQPWHQLSKRTRTYWRVSAVQMMEEE